MTTGPVLLQQCVECTKWNVPALEKCPIDAAHQLTRAAVVGTGTVFAYTITHVAMSASAKDHVPYPTTLIELSEGPRLVTHFAGERHQLSIGLPVTVTAVLESTFHMPTGALLASPTDQSSLQQEV